MSLVLGTIGYILVWHLTLGGDYATQNSLAASIDTEWSSKVLVLALLIPFGIYIILVRLKIL
jgi:hypothetical protein